MAQPSFRVALESTHLACRPHTPTAFFQQCRRLSTATISRRPPPQPRSAQLRRPAPSHPRRTFTQTPPQQATVVLRNPRVDEDGKEMTISISERAAQRLKQITSAGPQRNTLAPSPSSSADAHLRVTVTSGGCHGFQYLMSLENSSKINNEDDTVFAAEIGDSDGAESSGKAEVVLDEPSLELLKGSTVDFTTELIGSQFKIVGNPRAKSSCGCGTSFDLEE